MKTSTKAVCKVLAGALLTAATTLTAFAQSWPTQPIRMVVPYPPGGASDFTGRLYADRLGAFLGQPVVVENKAGAGGDIGAQYVASSAPDGYTLLMGAVGSHAINSKLPGRDPKYKFPGDFAGISMGTSTPLAVVVRSSLPVKNIQELIALAKQGPGTLTFGSAGVGSSQHMVGEKFQLETDTKLLHVPYKGSGPAMTDLLGGQVDIVFETTPTLLPHIKSDKVRFLAVTTASRVPQLPDVPTLKESGVKNFDLSTRYALMAPKGTPADILAKISNAMGKIAQSDHVKNALLVQGAVAQPTSPAETDEALASEVAVWGEVIERAGID